MTIALIHRKLQQMASPERARICRSFFKTGPGEYGAGDQFIGLTVPQVRQLALQFRQLDAARGWQARPGGAGRISPTPLSANAADDVAICHRAFSRAQPATVSSWIDLSVCLKTHWGASGTSGTSVYRQLNRRPACLWSLARFFCFSVRRRSPDRVVRSDSVS